MIRLRNVRYRYPSSQWVLQGIDLAIHAGEYVFVCGASGSGKSTLGYLLNGLAPHFFGGELQGTVSVDGIDTKQSSVSELFAHVGLVLQNADAQLFNSTVEDEIAFGLESLGVPGTEVIERVREVASELHIERLLDRSPMALSGGEQRLVAIASVLCLNPSVLLLDEPYAHLDWEGVKRVREALREIHRRGKTVVVIEQQMGVFLLDATRCLIVDKGKLVLDVSPQAAHTVLLEEHLIPSYPQKRSPSPGRKDPVLALRDLNYRIEGREILKGISLEFRQGEAVAIIGKNGAGKTTLIKHFNGLLRPCSGEVTLEGKPIGKKAPAQVAAEVGLVFQNANDQFFKYRVRDELSAGPRALGKVDVEWFEEICDEFDLHELLERSPYRLSEGEKKRVAMASILAMKPRLLVLDEPTAGQDGRFREVLATLLAVLEEHGFTTIIVTHDLPFARAVADRWIVLHDGQVVSDGAPRTLLGDERLSRLGALGTQDEARQVNFGES